MLEIEGSHLTAAAAGYNAPFRAAFFKGSSVNTLSFKHSVTHCRMRTSIIYSKVPHEALFVNQAISRQHLVVISTTVDTWSLQPVKYEAVK